MKKPNELIALNKELNKRIKLNRTEATERYMVLVEGCVEPELHGPYDTDKDRLEAARDHWSEESEDCIFRLNIVNGRPEVAPFSNLEMEDEE